MRKKLIRIGIMLMISCLFIGSVWAVETFQIGVKSDKTQYNQGEKVTIEISLENLNLTTEEQGISAYSAKIEYDADIFENATFSGTNQWEGSMQNGAITGATKDGKVVSQEQTIATVTLMVKEDAKLGSTTISVSNFVGSNETNEISGSDGEVTINIVEETQNQVSNNAIYDNGIEGTNTVNNTTNMVQNVTNSLVENRENTVGTINVVTSNNHQTGESGQLPTITDNTIANTKIPQTGENEWIFTILALSILGLIVALYIRQRRVK